MAVVTGAAQGLGRHFCGKLAALGYDIAAIDLQSCEQTQELVTTHGGQMVAVCGDAADPDVVAALCTLVRQSHQQVHALVNNAGISPYAPFTETDLSLWHRVLRTNLDSMYLLSHALLDDLAVSGHGRIVNLSSSVVWDMQARNMVAYATSKAGIVGFTRAMAAEVGPLGITVNAIAPGIVMTPDIVDRVASEQLQAYRDRQAIKQLAQPGDLLSALAYLVDPASQFITGAVLPVNGGRVAL